MKGKLGLWGLMVAVLVLAAACSSPDAGGGAASGEGGGSAEASTEAADQGDINLGHRQDDEPPPFTSGWKTDWSRRTISLRELEPGGPPRDGIPPIDEPKFTSVEEAARWLQDREPVVLFRLGDDVRVYPLSILILHEVVNDTVNDTPVVVTFCPLCNSAIAFDRRVGGKVLTFGVSGFLRNSDLVMWDRQTESLWQQVTGEAIVGELAGEELTFYPAAIVPWGEVQRTHPQARVLSRDTGFYSPETYGVNPYRNYDYTSSPFLFSGEKDPRLPALERVVALNLGGEAKAYPFSVLAQERVVYDRVGGQDVVVLWVPGTASALSERRIATARDVGAATVWSPLVGGRRLTLAPAGDALFKDRETGSTWNILGQAIAGPLAGSQLAPIVHGNHFWFAWAAFNPDTAVYGTAP